MDVDDLLAEVETDKATMEFRSFDRGVILKILAGEGDIVKLGASGRHHRRKAGDDISALVQKAQPPPVSSGELRRRPRSTVTTVTRTGGSPAADFAMPPSTEVVAITVSNVGATGRVKASPYVRKLARERGIDLHRVSGSGPGGRIVARDLDGVSASAAPATTVAMTPRPSREPDVRPLSMMRKTIARRLTESKQTVPHFYLTIDVDAGPLFKLRKTLNADLTTAPEPMKVSFNDLIIKAVAIAITRSPDVNAQFTPDALVFHKRVDISVAVAVDEGLVTPVVRDADMKSVTAISTEVRDLAGRARTKKLRPEEMMNGTFSISNLGMYGIDEFAAVINPPEGAILAVGGIRSEPVVSGEAIVPGKRMRMTLSCDHRVVDGAVGARFLAELRKVVENPTQILAY